MRRRLTKVGNSYGLILPRDVLDLLGVDPSSGVEVELAGNTLLVTAPDRSREDLEAALAYLASKGDRSEVYRRFAE